MENEHSMIYRSRDRSFDYFFNLRIYLYNDIRKEKERKAGNSFFHIRIHFQKNRILEKRKMREMRKPDRIYKKSADNT